MSLVDIFSKKPKIENTSLQRILPRMKEWKKDTVCASTNRNCSLCGKYNLMRYSFYGWNKKYQRLPELLYLKKCPKCNCYIGMTIDILHSK